VTDDKGASDSCTANVTVIDNERPTITAPVPVSVSTDTDKCSASNVALGTPITGDNCGVTNVVNNAPSEFLKGITVFTWTVTDTSDNMNTGTQTVNVNDNTPPVPNAAELPTLQGQCSATISTYPTATDNCSGNLTGTTTDPLTYTSPGTYTVTWKYTDSSQNISTQMQGVIVKDTESPSILDIYATPSEFWPPNKKMVDVTINYTPNDNCGQTTCSISNVSCNEKITSLDYSIVDAHHVKLRADRDGKGTGRVYTITINCKDAANNSTNQGVTVTVPHDQGSPK
jgi:hypothetical protein